MRTLLAAACLSLAICAPVLAQSQSARGARLAVGDPLPPLEGEYLSGGDARLPKDVTGQVAILALGFSYDSRTPVEAWMSAVRNRVGGRAGLTWLQIPMVGGAGRLAKPFITRGMRRDTPAAEQKHVVTVFGVGAWKRLLDVRDDTAAYLVLVDRAGVVRWLATERTVAPARLDALMAEVDRLAPQGP